VSGLLEPSPKAVSWLRRAVGVVLVAGFVACAAEGGSTPADPGLLPPGETQGPVTSAPDGAATATTVDLDGRDDIISTPDPDDVPTSARPATTSTRTALPGFGEVVIQVRRVDGQVVEWCLLLAETEAQRSRGLMEVADPTLGGYDGMLFRFDTAAPVGFYMRNTAQPISIAYLDDAGGLISVADMTPCADVDGCPTYPPGGSVRWAVEVPAQAGGVDALAIEPGVVVVDTRRTCAS
jgi:uncharacterized membrane protein (UPF0127 family)